MKRDMDLIRNILLAFENSASQRISLKSLSIEGASEHEIDFHVQLLKEAGFIDHHIVRPESRTGIKFLASFDTGMRLTMNGYDFLESIRDKDVWERTKAGAKTVGNASLGFIWEIAKGFGKQLVKDKLGIEI